MKKFWRSGMVDKKIVREREQEEYINRLHRTILELRKQPPEPKPCCVKRHNGIPYVPVELSHKDRDDYWLAQHRRDVANNPLTPAQSAKKWGEGVKAFFTGEYDEVNKGNGEVILDFYKPRFDKPKETSMDDMLDWMAKNLRDHPHYDGCNEFWKKTLNEERKAHGFEEVKDERKP